MRIGHGFDAHRFVAGRPLVLGGVVVPYEQGLAAHSDGDVLIHALCDAMLGAAGLGDIGRHFPDTEAAYEGVDSRVLLRASLDRVRDRGLLVSNADITVVAEQPKLAPHIQDMHARLASDLDIPADRINVKATTTEGMGFTGRGEGIAAFAVVLLEDI